MASRYRLKRGPVIGLALVVGVVGGFVLLRGSVRPTVDVAAPLAVPQAYDGTTYGFDGLVCVGASSVGATVRADDGAGTRIGLRPAGTPVTVAFPVAADALRPLDGARLSAGDELCTRLLVTPRGQGPQAAARVTLHFSYGPLGLLRTSRTVTPPITFQVTGTGTDPRAAAAAR